MHTIKVIINSVIQSFSGPDLQGPSAKLEFILFIFFPCYGKSELWKQSENAFDLVRDHCKQYVSNIKGLVNSVHLLPSIKT